MNIVCGWVCFVRFTLEFYRLFYSKKSKADSERQRLNFAVLFLLLFMGIFSFFCGECNPLSDTHTLSLSRSISLTSRLLKFLFVHFECRLGVHCLRFPFFISCVAFFSFFSEWTMITGCTSKSIVIIYVVYFHFQFLLEFSRFFNDLRVHCLTVVVPLFKYNPACFSFSPHYLLLELSVRNLKPRLRFMLGYLISFAIQNVNWRRYSSVSSIENHLIFALIFRFQ